MNKIDKIKEMIKDFHKKQDKYFAKYQEEEKAAREKYSEQGFKLEFMMKTWPVFAAKAQSDADSVIRNVTDIFDEIEEDFEHFVMRPLNPDIISTLNCINNFEIRLSAKELKILEQNIHESYLGKRVFAGLAEKNGYVISIPSADKYIDDLENARSNTKAAIQSYAGQAPSYPGRDLLGEWEWQGMKMGEYQDHHLYMAANFLNEGGTLDRLAELWDSAKAPFQYILNPSETEKVKKSIEKIVDHGKVNKEAAGELLKSEPDFVNRLKSMPEGSMKEFESVSKYFGLDSDTKEKAQESIISPAMEQASKYMSNRQPIDESLLAKFK